MERCSYHDSNFGVRKSGIDYLKQSQCYRNFYFRDRCSHSVCIAFIRPVRQAVVPASDDFYRDSGSSPRDQAACMLKRPRSFDVLRASRHISASKS